MSYVKVEKITLPSWVPQWDKGTANFLVKRTSKLPGAASNYPLVVRVIEPRLILHINGVKVGILNRVSPTVDPRSTNFSPENKPGDQHILSVLWRDICGQAPVFSFQAPYQPTGSSALVAFLDTVSRGWEAPVPTCAEDETPMKLEDRAIRGISYLHEIRPSINVTAKVTNRKRGVGIHTWQDDIEGFLGSRKVAQTQGGYYGLCPKVVEKGDMVVVLFGGVTPFVLRPVGNSYVFLGQCYVHGLMQGQALGMLERGEVVEETFEIR